MNKWYNISQIISLNDFLPIFSTAWSDLNQFYFSLVLKSYLMFSCIRYHCLVYLTSNTIKCKATAYCVSDHIHKVQGYCLQCSVSHTIKCRLFLVISLASILAAKPLFPLRSLVKNENIILLFLFCRRGVRGGRIIYIFQENTTVKVEELH